MYFLIKNTNSKKSTRKAEDGPRRPSPRRSKNNPPTKALKYARSRPSNDRRAKEKVKISTGTGNFSKMFRKFVCNKLKKALSRKTLDRFFGSL